MLRTSALVTLLIVVTQSGCTHPLQRRLEEYRSAKRRGDYDTAAQYLAADLSLASFAVGSIQYRRPGKCCLYLVVYCRLCLLSGRL